jgi:hypothetical protein
VTISNPASVVDEPIYDRNGVRRSKNGRPYVKQVCDPPCDDGRVAGARAGTTKQCPSCKGKGMKEVLYTRCTSFVGVLESRQNLEAWQRRITLLGLAVDGMLWADLLACSPDDRDAIDAIADKAFEVGDGHAAAQKGTDLHALSECVDSGTELVTEDGTEASFADRLDMGAYLGCVQDHGLTFTDMECFVTQDDLKIGGTFDRRAVWSANPCDCGLPVIFDLKTGRIDYGQGKICQQLGVYAHSDRYDAATGARAALDVCQRYGLILHLPQGTGTASLHQADLRAGWDAVQLSAAVREHRRVSNTWLKPIGSALELSP